MADSEPQGLTADTAPADGDLVLMVIDPAGTPLARKMTVNNLLKAINVLSADTTPDGSDLVVTIDDPSGTPLAKKVTITNLFAGRTGKFRLSLPPSAGYPPDDSSGSAAAQLQMKITSDVTDPQVRWPELLFDATTEEHWYWSFAMPSNYGSAPIVDVYYKATSATTGTAAFNAKIMAITPDDAADMDIDEFAAEQTAGSEAVPGTAGIMSTISVTLSNADSVAANDFVVLAVFRDVSEDGVTGDLEVPMVVLRYTGA